MKAYKSYNKNYIIVCDIPENAQIKKYYDRFDDYLSARKNDTGDKDFVLYKTPTLIVRHIVHKITKSFIKNIDDLKPNTIISDDKYNCKTAEETDIDKYPNFFYSYTSAFYQEIPDNYTGIFFRYNNAFGIKTHYFELTNGVKNGVYQELSYYDEAVLYETQYQNGTEQHAVRKYYLYSNKHDENRLIKIETIVNSKKKGITIIYDIDGNVLREVNY